MKCKLTCRTKSAKLNSYKKTESALNKSCDQMDVIMRKISHLDYRQKLSMKRENNPVTMTLNLELQVLRGMYNVFYQYAEIKSKQLEELYKECSEEMMKCDEYNE